MNQKMLEGEFSEDERVSAFNTFKALTLIPFANGVPLPAEIPAAVPTAVSPTGEAVNSRKPDFVLIEFRAPAIPGECTIKERHQRNYMLNFMLTKSVHFRERSYPFRVLF
jgi:hypothetical protein